MASLLYLKHAFNLSDEEVVERWSENVVWQYFSGQVYYEPRFPCDATQLGRFRRVIGEAGVEELLKATVETAVATKAVRPTEFERVIVDTTVQEKAIAHPVNSRLLEIARAKVVKAAKAAGIELKQTFAKEGKALRRKAGGIALSQAVQTAAAGGQAPAYCARYRAARDPAQAGHGQHRVAGDVGPTEYLAGARRTHLAGRGAQAANRRGRSGFPGR